VHSDGSADNPVCGFCGGIVPPNFSYCTHCGADLTPIEAAKSDAEAAGRARLPGEAPDPHVSNTKLRNARRPSS
jgi:hypothetical protein